MSDGVTVDVGPSWCPGPLVWFDAPDTEVVLECATCQYVHVGSGRLLDVFHHHTPLLREGISDE